MYDVSATAALDQRAAAVRDWLDQVGVNIHDRDQLRALRAAWLYLAHNPDRWGFLALGDVLG